jgi:Baseplate wedge protein gp25
MARTDYAFPFRIDGASNEAARATYSPHVDQMIRQILLTAPGERVDLPEFGCGLRNLLFAPNSDASDGAADGAKIPVLDWVLGSLTGFLSLRFPAIMTPKRLALAFFGVLRFATRLVRLRRRSHERLHYLLEFRIFRWIWFGACHERLSNECPSSGETFPSNRLPLLPLGANGGPCSSSMARSIFTAMSQQKRFSRLETSRRSWCATRIDRQAR